MKIISLVIFVALISAKSYSQVGMSVGMDSSGVSIGASSSLPFFGGDSVEQFNSIIVGLGFQDISTKKSNFAGGFARPGEGYIRLSNHTVNFSQNMSRSASNGSYIEASFGRFSLPFADLDKGYTQLENYSIGIGSEELFGYPIGGGFHLLFGRNSGLNWYSLTSGDRSIDPASTQIINYLSDGVRFGQNYSSIISFRNKGASIGFEFQRNTIYQRHLFFRWTTSSAVTSIGRYIVQELVDKMEDSAIYPVFNFIVMGAYDYAVFELRRKASLYPLGSPEALHIDNFRITIGATIF